MSAAVVHIGGFAIEAAIGHGALATVYRGRRHPSEEPCAIKVLHEELAHDGEMVAHFLAEAQLSQALCHPRIVPCLDFGSDGVGHYQIYPWLSGGDVQSQLRQSADGRWSLVKTLTMAHDVAMALQRLNALGVVHGDIKPGNILLDDRGRACLADFGLARRAGQRPARSLPVGTLAYCSPEQLRSHDQALDGRSDVYALGATIYRCLSGFLPFDVADRQRLIDQILRGPFPSLADVGLDIPSALCALVSDCCAFHVDERIANATELLRRLDALIDEWAPSDGADHGHELAFGIIRYGRHGNQWVDIDAHLQLPDKLISARLSTNEQPLQAGAWDAVRRPCPWSRRILLSGSLHVPPLSEWGSPLQRRAYESGILLHEDEDGIALCADLLAEQAINGEVWQSLLPALEKTVPMAPTLVSMLQQHQLRDCQRLILAPGLKPVAAIPQGWDVQDLGVTCQKGDDIALWQGGCSAKRGHSVYGDPLFPLDRSIIYGHDAFGYGFTVHGEAGGGKVGASEVGEGEVGEGEVGQRVGQREGQREGQRNQRKISMRRAVAHLSGRVFCHYNGMLAVYPADIYRRDIAEGEDIHSERMVVIRGSVLPGAQVFSAIAVVVYGDVQQASISAAGEVVVKGQVIGPQAAITAGNCVRINGHIQSAHILGSVIDCSNVARHAHMQADYLLSAQRISGGYACAQRLLQVAVAGNGAHETTLLSVGRSLNAAQRQRLGDLTHLFNHEQDLRIKDWVDSLQREFQANRSRSKRFQRQAVNDPIAESLAQTIAWASGYQKECESADADPVLFADAAPDGVRAGVRIEWAVYQGVLLQMGQGPAQSCLELLDDPRLLTPFRGPSISGAGRGPLAWQINGH